jgi:hypothetical protein
LIKLSQTAMNMPEMLETEFKPWVREILWRRKWQLTPVFSPRSPVDRGSWQGTVHMYNKEYKGSQRVGHD